VLVTVDDLAVPATPAKLAVHPRRGTGAVPSVGEHPGGFAPRAQPG
jgi:hypothetical protein